MAVRGQHQCPGPGADPVGRFPQCRAEGRRDAGVDEHQCVGGPVHEGIGDVGLIVLDVQPLPENQHGRVVDLDRFTERGHGPSRGAVDHVSCGRAYAARGAVSPGSAVSSDGSGTAQGRVPVRPRPGTGSWRRGRSRRFRPPRRRGRCGSRGRWRFGAVHRRGRREPAVDTRTRTARPTAAPTPEPVEAMPEAMPWSRSGMPVAAAMNMVVKTTPPPMPSATSPGTSSAYVPVGEIARPSATAPSAPTARATASVRLRPNRVTSLPQRSIRPPPLRWGRRNRRRSARRRTPEPPGNRGTGNRARSRRSP